MEKGGGVSPGRAREMSGLNVGPLAALDKNEIDAIVSSAIASLDSDESFKRADIEFVARMAVAATGGHLAVQDRFFFECHREITRLTFKKMTRWKARCNDASGTRRNVVADVEGMLRVRDDVGRLAPVVPASISQTVNGTHDFSSWLDANVPRFIKDRALGAALSDAAPLPTIVTKDRRGRTVK